MSGNPQNATLNGDGFRFYRWTDAVTGEVHDLLSVTSIRKLCGESFPIVNWQIGNLIDTAMGTVKRPAIGKRGGPLKGKYTYAVDEFPSEFVRRYQESDGQQGQLDELRKWLREAADEPRNVAALRGTMVHSAIEKNVAFDRIERPWVEAAFMDLSARDRARAKKGVQDDDVAFVRSSARQYWDMRKTVPFVIIAREPQVFNLTMGYGGSADALVWFLPEGFPLNDLPKAHTITARLVESIGGTLGVGDWKTSRGVYTDQVVQVHAYGAGEFIGSDGVVDHRLTDLLKATTRGVLFHVRPTGWGVYPFEFEERVFHAFAGSVAFARFLATFPKPFPLFKDAVKGGMPEEEDE